MKIQRGKKENSRKIQQNNARIETIEAFGASTHDKFLGIAQFIIQLCSKFDMNTKEDERILCDQTAENSFGSLSADLFAPETASSRNPNC